MAEANNANPAGTSAPKRQRSAAKPAQAGTRIKLTQIRSPIGRQAYQRATLMGLGLNKMHRSRVLADTPAVRGMIERVKHLLRIEPGA